jgi:hypothetical protein
MPFGESYIEEFMGAESVRFIRKHVSIQESLEARLSELDDVVIDEAFIRTIEDNYPEVIAIMEASLARKFCQSKKAFVYLNCPTNYGKNFFFEMDSIGRTFTQSYDVTEFRGNSPEDFLKPIYLFVDEAEHFPSYYKINAPEYKRLYGGLTKVNLGMRILACANPMEDIERGVDPQLMQRIVVVKPSSRAFSHCGIEKNKSQRIWEKYIINRLSNLLNEWSLDGNFNESCQSHFEKFVKDYDQMDGMLDLGDILKENIESLLDLIYNKATQTVKELKTGGGFDFRTHMTPLIETNEIFITSPSRFIKELFKYFDDTRYKAFRKQFHSISELGKMVTFCVKPRKFGEVTKKGLCINHDLSDYSEKVTKKMVTEPV